MPETTVSLTRADQDSVPGSRGNFTGPVWVDDVAVPPMPSRLRISTVRFAPGSRTIWHAHPKGQVLVITDGAGLVGRRGWPPEAVRTGDTVVFAPGEWHWHGAGPSTFLTHLAVQEADDEGLSAERGAPVTDAEYSQS